MASVSGPLRAVVLSFLERRGDAQEIPLQKITAGFDQHVSFAGVLHSLSDYCFAHVVAEANQGLHRPPFAGSRSTPRMIEMSSFANSGSS